MLFRKGLPWVGMRGYEAPATPGNNSDHGVLTIGEEVVGHDLELCALEELFPQELVLYVRLQGVPIGENTSKVQLSVAGEAIRSALLYAEETPFVGSTVLAQRARFSYIDLLLERAEFVLEGKAQPFSEGSAFVLPPFPEGVLYRKPFAITQTPLIKEAFLAEQGVRFRRTVTGAMEFSKGMILRPYGGIFEASNPVQCTQTYFEIGEEYPQTTKITVTKASAHATFLKSEMEEPQPESFFAPKPAVEEALNLGEALQGGHAKVKLSCTHVPFAESSDINPEHLPNVVYASHDYEVLTPGHLRIHFIPHFKESKHGTHLS